MSEGQQRLNSVHYQPVVGSKELSATAISYISVADRHLNVRSLLRIVSELHSGAFFFVHCYQ